MPTTILDGETYEQARHRRFTEEAKVIEKIQQDEIIRMARELATRYGSRMCDEDGDTHGEELYCVGVEDIAEIIKQAVSHEREACAKVCDETLRDHYAKQDKPAMEQTMLFAAIADCAAAIRARGEK